VRPPFALAVALPLLIGCGSSPRPATQPSAAASGGRSDADKVRAADVSVLFVGNSHTTYHDLPSLVCDMIRFRHPEKTTYSHVVGVGFLDQVTADPTCYEEIDTRPWKYVVLQAQRISASGKYDYSRAEGIDLAKRAAARGATVFFYAEWGLKGVAGDGPRQEKVYREMAEAAGVGLAAPGRAWDLALAGRPDLPLHAPDGNHQSAVGAFLTAAVLCAKITGESPAPLAAFPYDAVTPEDRAFLANTAVRAVDGATR
jgi:hypothetical protein